MEISSVISSLVDSRGQDLWNQINQRYSVSIESSIVPEYSCYSEGNKVVISVRAEKLCPDSFAHEMLHVRFRLYGCYLGGCFRMTVGGDETLCAIFNKGLTDHVLNSLEHIKMLPEYLKMGFKKDLFIQDYNEHKCPPETLELLKEAYKTLGRKNNKAIAAYLSVLFAVKACPNNSFDYSLELPELNALDPKLFQYTEEMIAEWIKFSVENPLPYEPDYRSIVDEYCNKLKERLK